MLDKYLLYMVFINILTFALMWVDKRRAIRGKWRIPEFTLLGCCALGGCYFGFLAMHFLHHKTHHWQFAIGIPVMMVIHTFIGIFMVERYL